MTKGNKLNEKKLSPEQYNICFLGGTEPPFSGKFLHNKEKGIYACAVCNEPLFSSKTKFDSGTGWPSFYDVLEKNKVELKDDYRFFMHRIEVKCAKCGSHLGHVFDDGPEPTKKRYCINSIALEFYPDKK
jgi:peptide-methionine (R)-S-oxide reductase